MKGDFILLGVTGAAILIIPMAVTMGSGGLLPPPVTDRPGAPQGVTLPAASSASQGEGWQVTEIPGGVPAPSSVVQPPSVEQPPSEVQPPPTQEPPASQPAQATVSMGEYTLPVKAFKVLNRTTGKVEEVSVKDYVRGAIAAEMPASFHLEALKAQGVAALSYALYHLREQERSPDPLLLGAHFSADPDKRAGYMTEKQAKKFYGDNWQYNWDKICRAADEAQKWVLLYENQPIAAAYHAISAGSTEAAENIWQQAMPCLTSVDSSWDILAKGYQSVVQLTQAEIKERLKGTDVALLPNPDTWMTVEEISPAGYVTQVRVGNQTMSGNQLRNLLGLRSSSFRIERQGKDFLFYVVGYGHGAGLSQNGADYMARQGSSFSQILAHYYSGGQLTPVK